VHGGLSFFQSKRGEIDYEDPATRQYLQPGLIGPKMPRDRLVTEFEQKWSYSKFLEIRRRADKLKINILDEKKAINKWIADYEELEEMKQQQASADKAKDQKAAKEDKADDDDKDEEMQVKEPKDDQMPGSKKSTSVFSSSLYMSSFPYSPLFAKYNYDELKGIAKQVFTSPIHNLLLFSILKRRLEIAYDIQ
jgi:hypothetical protein